ncbi:MAG TPA: sugar ABC transporter substrate-binding protein, partial [Albitalea sp.]|nr:sugar ABC transporter substrate-binding protein [Albitalea sp.]
EAELVVQMLPEFERTHPGVKVQVQQLPWTAAHEKLLTAFAGDAMPDVAQMGNTWIPEMAALRSLEPLDPWIARSTVVNPADYFSGIWDTNVIDGVTQGVPWYVDTRLLFYRHDLLAQAGFNAPPKTWDEWRAMMQAIQARATPQQHALLLPTNEYDPLIALALQQSDPMLREQMSRGNFSSPGFRRALSFYAEIFAKGWAPGVTNNQIANVWNEFGRGSFVFYISGPWNIEEFKRRLPPEQQSSWMTAPLPGPDGPGASSAGGSSLVVFRSSRHKPEAWALIEYLSTPAQQLRFHAISDNLPPRRSAWADPRLAADVYARAFRDQLERAKPAPAVPEWERIANELQLTAARVVGNGESIDAATRELDARVDGFLEKRRWMLAQRAKAQP